jgi:hypothetical protein
MISRWLQIKDLLEAYSGKNTKRIITTRSVLYPKLEDQLYTWIKPINPRYFRDKKLKNYIYCIRILLINKKIIIF